jgi:hypothetical protein
MSDSSHEALVASINHNSKILGIKTEHEQQLAASLESVNVSALHAAFRLGFDAGVKAKAAAQKD